LQRKTAFYERVVLDNDPIARFSPNILLNLSHPEDSPLLLAPLSETEGGWGMCPTVFKSKSDSGYCQLLASLQKAKVHIDANPRYATRGFKPNRQYIREMKKFGILSQDFKLDKSDMDIFSLDERYWRYFWYDPRVGENWGPEVRKE
jgi:hypothetical protein